MDGTIALSKVAFETLPFLSVEKNLKEHLSEWFEFIGALWHNDSIKLVPGAFLNLSAAALLGSKLQSAM